MLELLAQHVVRRLVPREPRPVVILFQSAQELDKCFEVHADTRRRDSAGTRATVARLPNVWQLSWQLTADIAHLDLGQVRGPFRADLGVAVGALRPDRGKIIDDLLVRAAPAQEGTKVVAPGREKAGIELAIGRETSPRAVLAKCLRDR